MKDFDDVTATELFTARMCSRLLNRFDEVSVRKSMSFAFEPEPEITICAYGGKTKTVCRKDLIREIESFKNPLQDAEIFAADMIGFKEIT